MGLEVAGDKNVRGLICWLEGISKNRINSNILITHKLITSYSI